MTQNKSMSRAAFYTLLLMALMIGAKHVAARFAFNNGVGPDGALLVVGAVMALGLRDKFDSYMRRRRNG